MPETRSLLEYKLESHCITLQYHSVISSASSFPSSFPIAQSLKEKICNWTTNSTRYVGIAKLPDPSSSWANAETNPRWDYAPSADLSVLMTLPQCDQSSDDRCAAMSGPGPPVLCRVVDELSHLYIISSSSTHYAPLLSLPLRPQSLMHSIYSRIPVVYGRSKERSFVQTSYS